MKQLVLAMAALAALAAPAGAHVIYVPDSVATIQAGIDSAVNGDTVLVSPGGYKHLITWSDKLITVASRFLLTGDTTFISTTVIDADTEGTAVTFSGVDTTAILTGFTIKNGLSGNGGGIYCGGASPTIRYNIIEDNYTSQDGGGIMMMFQGAPTIEHNVIRHNRTDSWGGGIYIYDGSSPRVRWNLIYDNGVSLRAHSRPRATGMVVAGRRVEPGEEPGPFITNGGAILVTNYGGLLTKPIIQNNTIDGNEANSYGGGIYSNSAGPDVRNNVITSNQGYGVYADDVPVVCTYNDVWNNGTDFGGLASAGAGAISSCPLFVDSSDHDFHLQAGSPCIDAGDPGLPRDPDSTRSDMGAFYYPQPTAVAGPEPTPGLRPTVHATLVRAALAGDLLDAAGRRVTDPGPGVYFARELSAGGYRFRPVVVVR